MLRSSGFGISLFINIIIICLWHFLSYIISGHIGSKRVDYRRFPYRAKEFEKKDISDMNLEWSLAHDLISDKDFYLLYSLHLQTE